ncbi:hypothetical protein I79_008440 [Cricetulus griseus]|uniref:Uncharacterized protein n=1 Tax=Cricetulus griseus TaxID=10029 RepID=G3HD64_CRIGR|nr:hypothetical protein I79_008440 [Cricetulus griseus]
MTRELSSQCSLVDNGLDCSLVEWVGGSQPAEEMWHLCNKKRLISSMALNMLKYSMVKHCKFSHH